jgi:ClpX C4-type zinc finger
MKPRNEKGTSRGPCLARFITSTHSVPHKVGPLLTAQHAAVYHDRRMTLDETLLREARQARDRVIELQLETDRAQVNYQHTIRRLHAADGSLREVADALGLSHQRVHQIVETVTGKVALKEPRDLCNCTFCGASKGEAAKLIAGPGVFICDNCVALAIEVTVTNTPRGNERTRLAPVSDRKTRCSFCGKKVTKFRKLAGGMASPFGKARKYGGPGVYICDQCLGLCNELLSEQLPRA